jgi:YD repeat-containing protein
MKIIRSLLLLLALTEPVALATTYEYDDLGRLVRETYDNGVEIAFTYDAVGNRTSRTVTRPPEEVFADGFETGDASAWSRTVGLLDSGE